MKTTTEMQLVPITKLVPYVNNARTHSPEQINKLRSSLREFGFINPVIIDRDYGVIEKFIESLGERFNIREIAFDRWGAVQMVQNLEGMGFTVVPFGQGFKDMSPPTKELMKLVLEQRIAHGGHPVLRWMMDNIFIRTDPAGNIKPDKEKSTEKIDGAMATIMALDRAIRCGNENGASVYDDRGILFI